MFFPRYYTLFSVLQRCKQSGHAEKTQMRADKKRGFMKITISIIKIFKNHLFQNTVGVKDSGFEKTAFDTYFTYHDLKNDANSPSFTSLVSQTIPRRNDKTQHRQGTFAISGLKKTAQNTGFKKPACKLWEWDLYRLLNPVGLGAYIEAFPLF